MSDIYAKKQKAPIRSKMRIGTEKLGDMIMSLRIYAISRGMVGIYKNHGDTLHRYHRGTFFVVAIGGLIFQTAAFATCAKSS